MRVVQHVVRRAAGKGAILSQKTAILSQKTKDISLSSA
jgi:hypothetical protein